MTFHRGQACRTGESDRRMKLKSILTDGFIHFLSSDKRLCKSPGRSDSLVRLPLIPNESQLHRCNLCIIDIPHSTLEIDILL
jgi:hypothetical protein